jgi:hypothetical protein
MIALPQFNFGRSLTKMMKSSGPSTEPCGSPNLTANCLNNNLSGVYLQSGLSGLAESYL